MTIKAEILLDSITPAGKRLTTWVLTYPRFIHAEFMTHRVFSRNAASSRAIPFKKIVKAILTDTAKPVHWGANQSGMQAKAELTPLRKKAAQILWKTSGIVAVGLAYGLYWTGVHKQVVNRVIEPWSHITVIATASSYDNFFELRAHPDAQPEFQELAYQMKALYDESIPNGLGENEWHLPFIKKIDYLMVEDYLSFNDILISEDSDEDREVNNILITDYLKRISAARCARVSYLTHDKKDPDISTDLGLYNRLVGSRPMHASPVEHQARAAKEGDAPGLGGNFGEGFVQFRKQLELIQNESE